MSKIDKRIVELGFENKSFEKGIKDSQNSLKDFNATLDEVGNGKSISQLGRVVEGLGGKFSVLETVATGALLTIGSQVAMLGQQIINRFAIAPVKAGFNEYELKINSIKTMLAGGRTKEGLPVTLEMVNEELQKLNEYSDQTIYSFADMTQNIGKFTNAGVDLETAVQAIKGIANSAALSGASAGEASRAMYNFSQALSAGYVKLIDWKSIENANMATVEFKQQLIDSAVAAGTLEKQADGMYKIVGSNNPAISATKGFNDSLQEQWMTSKVLTDTLVKYTDVTTVIGKNATEAATKVRTFRQIIDVTGESIQSGWAAIFENIVGDFNQATNLWTGVSNTVNGIISSLMDPLIEMFETWNVIGGRKDFLDGINSAWKTLSGIVTHISEAFKSVFPMINGIQLSMMSESFAKFMKKLEISEPALTNIKTIFQGLFSIFSLAFKVMGSVFKGFASGISKLISVLPKNENGVLLGFLAKFLNIFTRLNIAAKNSNVFIVISKTIADSIGWIATKLGGFIKVIKDSKSINSIINVFVNSLNGLKKSMGEFVKVLKDSKLISTIFDNIRKSFENVPNLDGNGFDIFAQKIENFVSSVKKVFEPMVTYIKNKIGPSIEFLKELVSKVKDFVSEKWNTMGFEGIIDILKGLLSGGVIYSLMQFVRSITGLSEGIKSFGGIKNNFNGVLRGLQITLKAYQDNLKSKQLITIAGAIGILVASLFVLTLLDESKMLAGIGVISALVLDLSAAMVIISKFGGGMRGVGALLVMASAIFILAGALSLLKDVNPDAIYAMSAILAELVISSILMGKIKKTGTANFIGMAVSLAVMAGAVKIFGNMDINELKQGIAAVSILFGEMLIFSLVMGKIGKNPGAIMAAGVAMSIIAVALLELTGVVAILAQFDPNKLVVGLGGLAGIMLVMATGIISMANPKVLIGAAAMIIMSAAVTMLVPAIAMLGALPIKNIAIGIATIAATFAVLGISALVLSPILPVIIGLSAAVALLGIGMIAAGSGLMLFGTGLALVSAAGVGAVSVLVLAVSGLVSLIPLILKQIGFGIIALAETIGNGVPALMEALGKVISGFLNLIATKAPEIVETVLNLITILITMIGTKIPEFITLGLDIIIAFLGGISEKIPELIKSGIDIVIAFIEGISNEIPRVIDAAFSMVIDFINGLATSIETNTPLLLEAVANLCTAFIDGVKEYFNIDEGYSIATNLITGLKNGVNAGVNMLVEAVTDLGSTVLNAIRNILGIASPSVLTEEIGEYLDEGLIRGLENRSKNVINTAKGVGEASVNALRSTIKDISNAVDYEINSSPVITPVLDLNNVKNGAGVLKDLLSNGNSYSLAASKIKDDRALNRTNQNESDSLPGSSSVITNQFILKGVTIRSEADIDKLAEKLYSKQENAMRGRGIKPAYVS